ncbi:hypothetical protein EDC01DRAFT_630737 [Geopyxis carbonaria]|nr:hypothetical protein EDC01DRAFT_630737 [Geopyxis carbonaria]
MSKASVARLAQLAKKVADTEARLERLEQELQQKNRELSNKNEEIKQKENEINNTTKQLADLDRDVQHVLSIGHVQNDEKALPTSRKKLTFDDASSLTDLSEFEPEWEAMGWFA